MLFRSNSGSPRPRHDSNQVLTLPTPLSVGRPGAAQTPSVSTIALSRESEEGYNSDIGSQQRLVSPQEDDTFEARVNRTGGVLRQSTTSASAFPGETQNPYAYSPQSAGFDEQVHVPFAAEPEEVAPYPGTPRGRGVSLSDNGPVPGPGGVRRVSRQQGRRQSVQPQPQQPQNTNRYSRQFSLPPGAAPPQPQGYGF